MALTLCTFIISSLTLHEHQIRAVVYGDDIDYYVENLTLLDTHLISTARLDKPLLPLNKLHTTTFANIAQLTPGPNAEIDIVGVVLRCGLSKYAGHTQNRCREATISDDQVKTWLLDNVSGNFAGSSTAVTVNLVHRQVVSIVVVTTAASVGVFYIEAEMSISDDLQKCTFQIDLIDGSGSTTAFISGDPGEKLLSMKSEDIFDTTCIKNQLLHVDQIQQMLSKKLFHIQLRKSSWTNSNVTQFCPTRQKNMYLYQALARRTLKRPNRLMKATFVESESPAAVPQLNHPRQSRSYERLVNLS
ncbi:hypothetical protein H5410_053181, partial [Solanum commersonii]